MDNIGIIRIKNDEYLLTIEPKPQGFKDVPGCLFNMEGLTSLRHFLLEPKNQPAEAAPNPRWAVQLDRFALVCNLPKPYILLSKKFRDRLILEIGRFEIEPPNIASPNA